MQLKQSRFVASPPSICSFIFYPSVTKVEVTIVLIVCKWVYIGLQLGSTAIGLKTKEGVVLAVEKRITSPLLVRLLTFYLCYWLFIILL